MSTPDTSPNARSTTAVVVVALAIGMAATAVLTMLVFPGATEGVTTGAALLGFGVGWAALHALSRRTPRPQRWAAVPAVAMASTGLALIATAPSDQTLGVLTWIWPPLALALAGWTYVRMRRHVAGAGRWLVTATLLAFAAAAVGAGARQVSTEPFVDANPVPGTTWSVHGHDLHLDCRGQGSPTVVLFNGLGEFSRSWARIVDGAALTTRVCAYDRAGQGWSDDLREPQDGVAAAEDVHALLDAAGETGPYVVVGHSIGGPYAMTYADQYADDVAGMVLLDGTSPHQFTAIPSYPRDYAMLRRAYGVLPTLARLGLGSLLAGSHLPADEARPVDDMNASPRAGRNSRDEVSVLPEVFEAAQQLTTLGDRPLAVLTSTETAHNTGGWTAAQIRLAALSSDVIHRYVNASHQGMVEDPAGAAASVQAITSVLQAIRTHTPLATP
ncbi:alpha/beta fold hydrolase [Nocardioides cavernae]|uniref:Alpha/beta fold hydrolase n=1 Tax=Nocardioides cavernae TaxID=1921566 RepID=A0ABR8NIW7_9ACTN|nr:alpha/beta fold hydrolase [Nocardioides cavernae]MBD3926389.1 alpha/beta fold hydrolase [Nocardioides cavernae]MBM7512106.1 pimeloyl-ACP methyl ester carboxylesterase [Nocardioides cavernae]